MTTNPLEGRMKAIRLLKEGKVKAELITDRNIHFRVEGDTGTYTVKFNRVENEWSCDCKRWVMKGLQCSHILASELLLSKLNLT
jgi:hypothetical protein